MSETLIELQAVSKRFPLGRGRRRRWRTVLDQVDLELLRGESLAILGENGAGKSTLMKLIAGVHRPSAGQLHIHGRLGALLELGAGFHPEHHGLDNLKAAATLMGVAPGEIDAVVAKARDFSELGPHLDKPLKHYSSGMVVRLGFALVAAVRPDVLISDEVLAVGDESFQKKCIGWLEDYLATGGTLLLVSHNLFHAQKLCRRAAWLHQGRIVADGDVFETVQSYLAYHESRNGSDGSADAGRVVHGLELSSVPDADMAGLRPGTDLWAHIDSAGNEDIILRLRRLSGEVIWSEQLRAAKHHHRPLPTAGLLPGRYLVEAGSVLHFTSPGRKRIIRIAGGTREFGSLKLEHEWE